MRVLATVWLVLICLVGGPVRAQSVDPTAESYRQDARSIEHLINSQYAYPERLPGGVMPMSDVLRREADAVTDRPGLLRDISEVFAKDKMNVTGVNTLSAKDRSTAWMTFTVEVADAARLAPVLAQIARVAGVRRARRK